MERKLLISFGTSKAIRHFWLFMGPLVASREINTELGDKIYDDEKTVWFLMRVLGGKVNPDSIAGFCCARITDSKCELRHDYIKKEFRSNGNYAKLFLYRQDRLLKDYPGKPHEIVTNNKQVIGLLRKHGFKSVSTRGSYSVYRREP